MKKFIAILIAALMIIPLSTVFSTAAETNIAQGKSYTFTGKHVSSGTTSYPDTTGKELTDGVTGSKKEDCAYNKDHWVGLNWKGENTECTASTWDDNNTLSVNYITVDLGAAKNSLKKFVLYATQYSDSVNKPKKVEVLVSSDNNTFTPVGTAVEARVVDAEVAGKDNYGIYTYTVTPSAAASARYVKFKITAGGAWTHVSEVQVFQGEETNTSSTQTVKVPAETYSLITSDASKWQVGKCVSGDKTENATVSKSGNNIVISGSKELWPYAFYDIPAADQKKVKMSDFKLSYKFTVEGGKTNIILFCEGKKCDDNKCYVNDLTHLIVPDGQPGRDKVDNKYVDDLSPGTYEGTIDLSKLTIKEGELTQAGYITISSVKVFTVGGGKITIEKFALESIATKEVPVNSTSNSSSSTGGTTSNSSSSKSGSTSSTASANTSSKQVQAGDAGTAAFIIIAVVSLIGMSTVSIKKRRAR
jgi:hypothetical protein